MIFQVCSRYGDSCGNEDQYHYAYVEADSQAEVEAKYPRGFFVGWAVRPITVLPLPHGVQTPPKEPR